MLVRILFQIQIYLLETVRIKIIHMYLLFLATNS